MQTTTNLGLKKPESSDFYDVADQNENMDKLDTEVFKKASGYDPLAVFSRALFDTQGEVLVKFAHQAVLNVA